VKRILAAMVFTVVLMLMAGCGTFKIDGKVFRPDQLTATQRAAQAVANTATSTPVVQNLSPVTFPTTQVCQISFFWGSMPGLCPTGEPLQVEAAFQVYDGGYMLWEKRTGAVYLLYNGGVGRKIDESVITNWPEAQVQGAPPLNHVYPIRGFGRVWQHEQAVRDQIGWPLGLEQAYTAQVQLAGPDNQYVYVSLPNGQVAEYNRAGAWRVVK